MTGNEVVEFKRGRSRRWARRASQGTGGSQRSWRVRVVKGNKVLAALAA